MAIDNLDLNQLLLKFSDHSHLMPAFVLMMQYNPKNTEVIMKLIRSTVLLLIFSVIFTPAFAIQEFDGASAFLHRPKILN